MLHQLDHRYIYREVCINKLYIYIWIVIHLEQCSRLKSSMPFKHDVALQNIPLPKQPFKMQPSQIESEDVA
jgi:hypothetical protein